MAEIVNENRTFAGGGLELRPGAMACVIDIAIDVVVSLYSFGVGGRGVEREQAVERLPKFWLADSRYLASAYWGSRHAPHQCRLRDCLLDVGAPVINAKVVLLSLGVDSVDIFRQEPAVDDGGIKAAGFFSNTSTRSAADIARRSATEVLPAAFVNATPLASASPRVVMRPKDVCDSAMAPRAYPCSSGEAARKLTLRLPPDSPQRVILSGSPPKCAMLFFTHLMAAS